MTPFTILWRFYNCSLITHCGIHSFNKYSPRPGSIDCSEIQWKLLAAPRHILGKTPFSQCASASQVIRDLFIHRWKSVHFELKPHSQKGTEYVEHNFADNPNQMEMTQWSSGRIIEGKRETFENFDAEHCTAKRSQTGLLWLKSKQQELLRSNTLFKT